LWFFFILKNADLFFVLKHNHYSIVVFDVFLRRRDTGITSKMFLSNESVFLCMHATETMLKLEVAT